jgi:hypothetical protein
VITSITDSLIQTLDLRIDIIRSAVTSLGRRIINCVVALRALQALVAFLSRINHNVRSTVTFLVDRIPNGMVAFGALKILQAFFSWVHIFLTFACLRFWVELFG